MNWQTNIFIIAVLIVTICPTLNGISLHCRYEMSSLSFFGSTLYTCIGRVLFNGSENVTEVSGNHQTDKAHQDVLGIRLPGQNLKFFQKNIESFFPNIIGIDLRRNSITTVSSIHLIPFPNLKYLWLQRNNITSIDGDLFSGINSMELIMFSHNDIRHVGHDLNLPINGEIQFDENPCIDQSAWGPDDVASLKLNLLRNCPPTISQIEDSLQKRQNFLTDIDGQIQSLVKNMEKINDELAAQLVTLRNEMNAELETQLATQRNEINDELVSQRSETKAELATLRYEQENLWLVMYDLHRRIENLETVNEAKLADQLLIATSEKARS